MTTIQYTIPAKVTGDKEKNITKKVRTLLGLWLCLRKAEKAKAKGIIVWF